MTSTGKAVLLMAYGSPSSLEEVPAYYTDIRGGRAPSPGEVEELQERYSRIGGRSPFTDITLAQARALEDDLASRGRALKVYVGMRHWRPSIAEAVSQMRAEGVVEAVALALTPYYSHLSVGAYIEAARRAVEAQGGLPRLRFVKWWHRHPLLVSALADTLGRALEGLRGQGWGVIFTAHSLPLDHLPPDDPYQAHLLETARAVAGVAGVERWHLAYQSAGRRGQRWLGPDLSQALQEAAREGWRTVVVAPIGFIADNLETLYDLDLEARERAEALGLAFRRAPTLNHHPLLAQALADTVVEALG